MRRAWPLVLLFFVAACKADPSAKLNAVRDQLATGSPTFDEKLSPCPEGGTCLERLAKDLGSTKGYSATAPDQASVGAVAVLVARDGHGEWAGGLDEWISVMQKGKGTGADALRLAVGLRLSKVLPTYAHPLTEAELPSFFKDVGRAIPGSCKTYARLGDGASDASLAIEDQSDHSPCVQKDLGREGGPGGTYGHGPWRAAAALAALARTVAHALEDGSALMNAKYKQPALDRAKSAREAIAKIVLVSVEQPVGTWLGPDMLETHGDGGLHGRDAGSD